MKITPATRMEWLAAFCAGLSAWLLQAVFAPWEWTGCAWVALVPLLAMARLAPGRLTLKMGFVAGLLFWLLSIRWLTQVTILGWIGLSAYCALYFLPPLHVANRWRGGGGGFALVVAAAWSGSEFIRGWVGTGFPWNPLGAGVSPWLPGIQLAEIGGVWLVSGLVVAVNALLTWALVEQRNRRALVLGAAVVAAALGWGHWRVHHLPPATRSLRVALVQPSIPQDKKWVAAKIRMIYERLTTLTRQAQGDPLVELVIWPETALPDDVRNREDSYNVVWNLCTNGTPILTGALDTALRDDGTEQYFNSVFLFDTDGRIVGEYDKRHLVLGGEIIPLERWLPDRLMLALGLPTSITAGDSGAVFPTGPQRVPLAPLVCFEDILPYLARNDVRAGARALVNVTNDAWFDDVIAPRQHMRNAVLRAVENRVPLIRAANTGVSCVIEPTGAVSAMLTDGAGDTAAAGVLWATVAVPDPAMPLTCYARFGDMYAFACVAATGLWLLAARRQPRTKE